MYPLFKIHKLNIEQIHAKVIPPTRMVTSGVGGPTYRLGVFIDNLLKPVVQKYCANELVKDSTSFIKELRSYETKGSVKQLKLLGTLDVDALYPSIRLELALKALKHALEVATAYSSDHIAMILNLAEMCIKNSVICYRGLWYKTILGIPTGGPESGSIANIVVYFVLETILLPHPRIKPLNRIPSRLRFLDDLWFGWQGTERQFTRFKAILNEVGKTVGITFKGEVGKSVDFLDMTVELKDGHLSTKMYIKPTDSSRYLHRRSDHSLHTFTSIPFSQFRRSVVLCSSTQERNESIDYISKKLKDSGYKDEEISNAKKKALKLDREKILTDDTQTKEREAKNQLIFTLNRDKYMSTKIKELLEENQNEINEILGEETRLIVAEKRNQNLASTLFAKSSFSKELCDPKDSQKCKGRGCKTCPIMNLEKSITLWENDPKQTILKLDYRCDCTTDNLIYLFLCKLCPDNKSFYVGQSTNTCRKRTNGHRSNFSLKDFKKSALSFHMFQDHPENFDNRLCSYDLGVIKSTSPLNLDRCEDFYIELTKAHLSLNRYKVTQ